MMSSERAAFQSCLSEFMVMVEEMDKLEVIESDCGSEEVISREVSSPFLGTGKSSARSTFGEEFRSVRTSFSSCIEEDSGKNEDGTTQPTVERRVGVDSVFTEDYQSARASFGSHLEDKDREFSQIVS